jgi:2-polyprenyl-3-methyl-5-hydroxy-6-metoxy-1,4-benzoquinol methylase
MQAEQYRFPYHYLVDLDGADFVKNLDWGLDYWTYMRKALALTKTYLTTAVLDVGCGDGYLLNHLMRDPEVGPGVRALGVDVDEKPIKFAQAFGHGVPNLSFRTQDIATVEERFPLVTCVETLEHIPDDVIPAFTGHLDRVVAPGGTLVVSVPSVVRPVIPKHERHYTLDMLRGYMPDYRLLEVHYVTARRSLLYQIVAKLLANRYLNLNVPPLRQLLFALHERYTSDVSADEGAHIVAAFRKPKRA